MADQRDNYSSSVSNYSNHNNRRSHNNISSNRNTQSDYISNSSSVLPPDQKRRKIIQRSYPQTPDAWKKYDKQLKIGQGTFGEVFKAVLRSEQSTSSNDCKVVAMKKVLMEHEREGFPITALREIKILQTLNRTTNNNGIVNEGLEIPIGHENIVKLIEVCRDVSDEKDTPSVFLVFEFCEHDLYGLLNCQDVKFSVQEKKSIVQQMLRGLMYIHTKRIFHRDMKTSNVLVNNNGVVKLADFGLARPSYVTSSRQLTNNVVTLWYRPPELILGDNNYNEKIDIWGCGCIMAELWTDGKAIFQAKEEIGQLKQICEVCGTIDENEWPRVAKLKNNGWLHNLKFDSGNKQERKLKNKYQNKINDPLAMQLLDDMLKLNPEKRISANSALDSYWLWEKPLPTRPDLKKINQSKFELLARMHHRKQAEKNAKHNDPKRNLKNQNDGNNSGFSNNFNTIY